ncbi:MAG: hypothetical protein LIQ30_08450 [Planctomycetes bacterium]|nr:hypothetical protein [Planctomycetota bacterium]MCD7897050.1 hypothetical protein [Planctomycetaceae bacterium]
MAELSSQDRDVIWTAVHETPAVDIRVFALPPSADPAVSGIDALLTSPELLGEFFRRRAIANREYGPVSAREAYIRSLTPAELADLVWRQLFLDRQPLSEPARIVLTTMGMFGLDVASGDLRRLREDYEAIPPDERLSRVLALANVTRVLYATECLYGTEPSPARHPAFRPVLYVSDLLADWKESARRLRLTGYGLKARLNEFSALELRRYLTAEIGRIGPVGLGLDWPDSDGDESARDCVRRLVHEAVLPLARERNLPFFLGTGGMRVDDLADLWRGHPEVRFMLVPGRADEFAAAIRSAATSRNVLLAGPDQPLSFPRVIEQFHNARLETLGGTFHACHSSAGCVEELVGTWAHARWTLGLALIRHYTELWRTGWQFTPDGIRHEVAMILAGNAESFLGI